MKLIELEGVDFKYKHTSPIFKSFSLTLNQGEFLVIKGPSGSGKSTLLYLLAGLLNIQSGSLSIKGKKLSSLSDLDKSFLRNREIGFIFQQFHLLSKATVLDNICLPIFYPIERKGGHTSESRERAISLARELGIGHRLNYLPNQLSGGQQQRVAIARALINNPDLILADEPTGNLDSQSTQQIMNILSELHKRGKTIVLITHDNQVARFASRVCSLKDGRIVEEETTAQPEKEEIPPFEVENGGATSVELGLVRGVLRILPLALSNAFRNKARSFLTMLGIAVGVAAVCSMITLGNFTERRILQGYDDLGVNTLMFRGFPNWRLRATDEVSVKFKFFNWERDLVPLKKIFPDIQLLSPMMTSRISVTFSGQTIESEARMIGISEDGLRVLNRRMISGREINWFHVEKRSSVCVIGFDIGQRLFPNLSPLNQVIHISRDDTSLACRVIGVLESKTSNKEWNKPNFQVFVPFPVFRATSRSEWMFHINQVAIKLYPQADIEKVGQAIRKFFELKYGKTGRFRIGSDSILIAQMKKFLNLFAILLVSIALVCLTVGGIGITNMMLVSVSERLKEIGIRKVSGATHSSIRYQFLLESLFLCAIAGFVGILMGIAAYQMAIYGASRLIQKLEFEWVFEPFALLISLVSILAVGILSGLLPAIKAEKLQVIDALRSE